MRLLATADLHYNHPRSRAVAEQLIEEMNAVGGDVLLVIGDTAVADGEHLEACLGRFRFSGPKLLVAGNHELWTHRADSRVIFEEELPARAKGLGWHWLEQQPWIAGSVGVVGTIGWYDYSFAASGLGIPRRFYERKLSPGVALAQGGELAALLGDDVTAEALEIHARWNDGKFVKMGMSDEDFLRACIAGLERSLEQTSACNTVVAAVHVLPMAELLPPTHMAQLAFARAFLGSPRIGEAIARFTNVTHVLCGHSHFPVEAEVGRIKAVNIGSGYRWKRYVALELPDP